MRRAWPADWRLAPFRLQEPTVLPAECEQPLHYPVDQPRPPYHSTYYTTVLTNKTILQETQPQLERAKMYDKQID